MHTCDDSDLEGHTSGKSKAGFLGKKVQAAGR